MIRRDAIHTRWKPVATPNSQSPNITRQCDRGAKAICLRSVLLFACLWCWLAGPCQSAETNETITAKAAQILKSRCAECHWGDDAAGQFQLTAEMSPFAGAGVDLINVDHPSDSELLRRLASVDEDEKMPPKGTRLSDDEQRTLRDWIAAGAALPETWQARNVTHWSFAAPRRPTVPDVGATQWPLNPIDHFVLHRLRENSLSPADEAPRHVLIRRLSYDLRGLPPTTSEVESFCSDTRPDAYRRLVDRFLASPQFGERFGQHWLDLARYADSDGFGHDEYRPNAWRWRDWVIQSINDDQPFDEFSVRQIAGDLLPDCQHGRTTATGFHANVPAYFEDGVDDAKERFRRVNDWCETVGSVWLGLTLRCARCHDHRHDPISQQDYYAFRALFDDLRLGFEPIAEVSARYEQMKAEINALDARLIELRQVRHQGRHSQDKAGAVALPPISWRLVAVVLLCAAGVLVLLRRFVVRDWRLQGAIALIVLTIFVASGSRSSSGTPAKSDSGEKGIALMTRNQLQEELESLPTGLMVTPTSGNAVSYFHGRGEYLQREHQVVPAGLSFLPTVRGASDRLTRLDLARWLFSNQKPAYRAGGRQ